MKRRKLKHRGRPQALETFGGDFVTLRPDELWEAFERVRDNLLDFSADDDGGWAEAVLERYENEARNELERHGWPTDLNELSRVLRGGDRLRLPELSPEDHIKMEAAGWLFLYNCRLREDLGLNDAGATMLDTLVLAAAALQAQISFHDVLAGIKRRAQVRQFANAPRDAYADEHDKWAEINAMLDPRLSASRRAEFIAARMHREGYYTEDESERRVQAIRKQIPQQVKQPNLP